VDQTVAREIARLKHLGQSTRFGESVFAHVERVADRVPPEARNAALLHEIFELTATTRAELQAQGLSRPELAALRLLTTGPMSRTPLTSAGLPRRPETTDGSHEWSSWPISMTTSPIP
jgi:hypothetical protein